MINQLKGFLQNRSIEWNLPPNGEWTFLFFNNSQPQGSNLNLLWFLNGSEFPRIVTKLCLEQRVVRSEFENLAQVYACSPAFVPKPLALAAHEKFWGLWMEGVPGSTFLREELRPALLPSIVDMLASMHAAIHQRGGWLRRDRYRTLVSEPLKSVAEFSNVASIERGCQALATRISPGWLDSLPIIPQHGDLFMGNLLLHRHRWRVVDWETFGSVDFPFYDLITLLFSVLRTKGETPESWDPVVVKRIPDLIQSYAGKMALCPGMVSDLLPLTLANWFYVQRRAGHARFASGMHQTIKHYFENPDLWTRVFVASAPALARD